METKSHDFGQVVGAGPATSDLAVNVDLSSDDQRPPTTCVTATFTVYQDQHMTQGMLELFGTQYDWVDVRKDGETKRYYHPNTIMCKIAPPTSTEDDVKTLPLDRWLEEAQSHTTRLGAHVTLAQDDPLGGVMYTQEWVVDPDAQAKVESGDKMVLEAFEQLPPAMQQAPSVAFQEQQERALLDTVQAWESCKNKPSAERFAAMMLLNTRAEAKLKELSDPL